MLIPLFFPEHNEIFSNHNFNRKYLQPPSDMFAFYSHEFLTVLLT